MCSAVHVACWELVWAVLHVCIDCQYIYLSDMLHSHCFRHVLSDRLIKLGLWHAQSRQLYQQPEKSLPFTTYLSINTKPLRAVSGSLTYRKKLRWFHPSLSPHPSLCVWSINRLSVHGIGHVTKDQCGKWEKKWVLGIKKVSKLDLSKHSWHECVWVTLNVISGLYDSYWSRHWQWSKMHS